VGRVNVLPDNYMKEFIPSYSIGQFINEPANPTEFEVTRFREMDEPDVAEIHKHRFFEIIWVEKGQGKQTIDYKEYVASPGSLFFISPGQIHQFEEWKPLLGGSIMFTEDFLLFDYQDKDRLFEFLFLDNFYANACIHLDRNAFAEIKKTADLIFREQSRRDKSRTIIRAYLQVLLAQLQRYIDANNERSISKRQLTIYKKFQSLLADRFAENKTADFYASHLNMTQHHLNTVIKSITGKTTTQVIRARNILEAKRLLTFSDHTVSEIAATLNFFDGSYFTKLFKMETGITPVAFKSTISGKYQKW